MFELAGARSPRWQRAIWLAFMMLILVAGSLSATPAVKHEDRALYEPDEFCYSTSQLFSGTTEILWKDHALIFRSRPAGGPSKLKETTRRLVPNSHQWAEFWQTMDRLSAWSWHGDYQGGLGNLPDPRTTLVRIRHGNRAMKMAARDGGPKGFNEQWIRQHSLGNQIAETKHSVLAG